MRNLAMLMGVIMLAGIAFAFPADLADEMIASDVIWGVNKAEEKLIMETMASIRFNYKGDFIGVE